MKIIFLTRRFWPDRGGVEKHVYEISKVLIKKGHKVTVITETPGEIDNFDGIPIIRITGLTNGRKRKILIWKWMIKNRGLFVGSDIVHAHDVYYQYLPLKFLFLSKKSFITFHGYETYPIAKKSILLRKISELLADGNIIVGDFISKWYGTNSNYVIYGAVKALKESKKPKKLNSAIFIGRLDEHTGIIDYVKTVEIIRKSIPSFKIRIFGEGPFYKKIEKFKPAGFNDDAVKYLPDYNFAFVSRYLSILEAFAARRLVFALYDNPVKKDYLEMTPFSSFIIIADGPENLARKIKYFQKNPRQTKKFTDSAYKWVKKQTWENIADIYLKLWRKRS